MRPRRIAFRKKFIRDNGVLVIVGRRGAISYLLKKLDLKRVCVCVLFLHVLRVQSLVLTDVKLFIFDTLHFMKCSAVGDISCNFRINV